MTKSTDASKYRPNRDRGVVASGKGSLWMDQKTNFLSRWRAMSTASAVFFFTSGQPGQYACLDTTSCQSRHRRGKSGAMAVAEWEIEASYVSAVLMLTSTDCYTNIYAQRPCCSAVSGSNHAVA
ncbi:hypothetical protein FOQG_15599 [Fusarium oxysporum f. sp. raphani 54005]|uniref:Uncharacterized protein n=1 Tax=Fusarium oxysporum f. sp. raphani 54005 TaxID=1089458 RepID=X0CAZ8_FUSOX|nr:hypothetical protein FOQG_15599 [Fusarium oxysporum f. sp. raphani 54005]